MGSDDYSLPVNRSFARSYKRYATRKHTFGDVATAELMLVSQAELTGALVALSLAFFSLFFFLHDKKTVTSMN